MIKYVPTVDEVKRTDELPDYLPDTKSSYSAPCIFIARMTTVYFAKWILLPSGDILENGGMSVCDGKITSVGPRSHLSRTSRDRIVNLGELLLLPGFINMHTHLEEGVIRGFPRDEDETFTAWTKRRADYLKESKADTIISAVRLGIRESLANGITTIVDSTKTDISAIVLREEPIRSWGIHEVSSAENVSPNDVVASVKRRVTLSRRGGNTGLAPYALFSMPPDSQRRILNICRTSKYVWACHVAESAEELQAFSEQYGDIYDQFTSSAPWPFGPTGQGSLHFAVTNNLVPNHGICYHCNYTSSQEFSLLSVKNASVVLCPQYSDSMGHKSFPLDVALNRGINICLGTESPTISRPMNLLDELFQLKQQFPYIPAKQAIDMVTINPAKALRCANALGSLEPQKRADVVGLRFPHSPRENLLEELIEEKAQVAFVLVDGEEVIIGG